MKNLFKKYDEKFNQSNSKVKIDESWNRFFNNKNSVSYQRYEYCTSKLYGNVIDVGSGDGFGAYMMQKNQKIKHITCLEIQDKAISKAINNLKNFTNITIKKGIGEKLLFKDNYFDSVFCGETLEHVFDEEQVIFEIHRVVKDLAIFTIPIKGGISLTHIREYKDKNDLKRKLNLYFNIIEEKVFLDQNNITRIAYCCKKNKPKMKINYFDLGLHKDAAEIDMFINICKKNQLEYNIYGFEAHPEYCLDLVKKYSENKKINIINKAISNTNGFTDLYISEGNKGEGNSIFKTKRNVNPNNFVKVETILFSDWLNKNVPNFEKENNILRFNIEGAEWYLINDLNNTGLLKNFKIILGSNSDLFKVNELKNNIKAYEAILKNNNITIKKFTKLHQKTNCKLGSLIKKTFK